MKRLAVYAMATLAFLAAALALTACAQSEPLIVEVTRIVVVTATPLPATPTPEATATPKPTSIPKPDWSKISGTANWSYDGYWGQHTIEITIINGGRGDLTGLQAWIDCTGKKDSVTSSGTMPFLPFVISYGQSGTMTINDLKVQKYICSTFTVNFVGYPGQSWYFDFGS